MNPKISKEARFFFRDQQAGQALVDAIIDNTDRLHRGDTVSFTILVREGNELKEKKVAIKTVSPL